MLVTVPASDRGVNVGLEEEAKAKTEDIRERDRWRASRSRGWQRTCRIRRSKANGGLVGPLTPDVLAPELQKAIAGLKPGDVTPVLPHFARLPD